MLLAEVDATRISLHIEEECRTFPAYPTLPPRRKLLQLLELIARAERPLIVAGGGVNRASAGQLITELAEKYNIPMCTTMTGQGRFYSVRGIAHRLGRDDWMDLP
jgi:acetolactate synthase I/II/III large subunit